MPDVQPPESVQGEVCSTGSRECSLHLTLPHVLLLLLTQYSGLAHIMGLDTERLTHRAVKKTES